MHYATTGQPICDVIYINGAYRFRPLMPWQQNLRQNWL